ncbi:hypothetical protein GLW04_00795 [Halobacillus litoralis]|uniref:Uncharacterized protein n=1 Tax=Halobacillus litoralis TaxID=45668 RepID=A0A845DY68_9BACI|nr:hypothetical protein [Halobacillus litoralis]MYL18404.1 hypothetical protein [Halobacillus litoralis]
MEEQLSRLMEAKKDLHTLERLEREHGQLENELQEAREKEGRFARKLEEEKEDVEKLERVSLSHLFVVLTGQKLERMEKEKQEVVEAGVKWREAEKSRKEIEREIKSVEERMQRLSGARTHYRSLYEERKKALVSDGGDRGERLLELSGQRSQIQAERTEIEEAIQAGEDAHKALETASGYLTKAENWGMVDMFGGGLLSTAVKHSKMDEAEEAVHTAQQHLRKFANEMADIGEFTHADLRISEGWTIADYFLDGLIVDLFVQDKIQKSHEEVRKIRKQTHDSLVDLESLQRDYEGKESELKEEQDSLIKSS